MHHRAQHVEATATVDFVVTDGSRRLTARVSDEALCSCFAGFYGLKDPMVGAYLKNAPVIDNLVVRKARQGCAQPILLETADFVAAMSM